MEDTIKKNHTKDEYQKQYHEKHKDKSNKCSGQYYKKHKNEREEYDKQYYNNHREEILKRKKEYYNNHKEERALYNDEYYRKNKKKISDHQKEYYKQHKEERKQYYKKYTRTTSGKNATKRRDHTRRGLGFVELNKKFEGSEAHHIDKKHVINIPKELHHSIYHNLFTGNGMFEINMNAFGYLKNEYATEH